MTREDISRSATAKRKGIDNSIDEDSWERAQPLIKFYEELKAKYPSLTFNSWYRCPELNEAIGGSASSQHCTGEAVDIDYGEYNKWMLNYIIENYDFDQVIDEFPVNGNPSWIHVSMKKEGNRNQKLRSVREDGKTKYVAL